MFSSAVGFADNDIMKICEMMLAYATSYINIKNQMYAVDSISFFQMLIETPQMLNNVF